MIKLILCFFMIYSSFGHEIEYKFIDRIDVTKIKSFNVNLIDNSKKWNEFNEKLSIPYSSNSLIFRIKTSRIKNNKNILYLKNLSPGEGIVIDKKGNIIKTIGFNNNGYFNYFKLDPNQTYYIIKNCLIRFDDNINFISEEYLSKINNINMKFIYFFLGAVFFMLLYHLGNYIVTKDINFLNYIYFNIFYVVIILGFTLFFNDLFGHSFVEENLMFFSGLCCFFIHRFANSFLNFRLHLKRYQLNILLFLKYLLFISSSIYLLSSPQLKVYLNYVLDASITISSFLIIIYAYKIRKKEKMALFYLSSWIPLFLGIYAIYSYEYLNLFDNIYTRYAPLIGCSLEMIINSFGLAFKVKLLQIEKQKAITEAKEKDKYKRLLRVISHDISTPIATAQGWSQYIEDKTIKNKIMKAIDTACLIINNVKKEEKSKTIKKEFIHSDKLFKNLVSEYNDLILSKKININLKGKDFKFKSNESILINNVLGNILTNAIKFSTKESNIDISYFQDSEFISIEIKDYGKGMTKQQINSIISRDIVASTKGTKGELGTGLGLEIIHSYLDLLKGSLVIDSEVGKFTSFKIFLKK